MLKSKQCIENVNKPVQPSSSKHFIRMLSDLALEQTFPYLQEERLILEGVMCNDPQIKNMNFTIIGGGVVGHYQELASLYAKQYTIVEPYLREHFALRPILKISPKNTQYIRESFENYCHAGLCNKLPLNTFYVFWFNVVSYIKSPIELLNIILKKGDIVFFSGWIDTLESREIFNKYFTYVNGQKVIDASPWVSTLDKIQFSQLKSAKYTFIKQRITDIKIFYI